MDEEGGYEPHANSRCTLRLWPVDMHYFKTKTTQYLQSLALYEVFSIISLYFYYHTGLCGSKACWIGFNDLEVEGFFKWTDGTPLDFNA